MQTEEQNERQDPLFKTKFSLLLTNNHCAVFKNHIERYAGTSANPEKNEKICQNCRFFLENLLEKTCNFFQFLILMEHLMQTGYFILENVGFCLKKATRFQQKNPTIS